MDIRYILKLFHDCFEIQNADHGWNQAQFQAIRYQVYCEKFAYASTEAFPGQRESDAYDAHALSRVLVHKSTQRVAAGLRLVLPQAQHLNHSFPLQESCQSRALKAECNALLGDLRLAEISRFCISPQFLHRADDTPFGSPEIKVSEYQTGEGRVMPLIRLGLIQSLLEMVIQARISHCCALFEPLLLQLFHEMGIHFQILGDPIEAAGMRLPCWIAIEDLIMGMMRERPLLYQIVTREGQLWHEFQAKVLQPLTHAMR